MQQLSHLVEIELLLELIMYGWRLSGYLLHFSFGFSLLVCKAQLSCALQRANQLVDQLGMPLELDTDGI